jgi:hypothetical protein
MRYFIHIRDNLYIDLEKAKRMPIGTVSKGRKKVAEGKWVPIKEKSNSDQVKLKMRFDSHDLLFSFESIGYSTRYGNEKTSKAAIKTAEDVEKNIKSFGYESVSVIGKNGNVLFSRKGNYDQIVFSDEDVKKIRKSEILTHTHPEDKSFSAEDVFLGLSLGVKELRLKTPGNVYYFKISRKNKAKDEDEVISDNRTFMNILIRINEKVNDILTEEVSNGKISQKDAEKKHREMDWEMITHSPVLSNIFHIEYKRITK